MEGRRKPKKPRIQRLKIVDGESLCWCAQHQDYLPCEKFAASISYDNGYNYKCIECTTANRDEHKKKKNEGVIPERELLNLFYRQCGYDPTSPIPIHEQFVIRHEL
jgi:hypothetical protein